MKSSQITHPKVLAQAEWFFLASMLLGFLINIFWSIWVIPTLIRIILGLISVVIGTYIMIVSWGIFEKEKTPVSPFKSTKVLVVAGPYKYSRNPQYLSRVFAQMGIGFFFGNIWIVIMAIPTLILVWYAAVIPEERYLEQRFGKKYLQYKASTRCWF